MQRPYLVIFFHKSETGFVFRYPIIVISAHTNPVSYNTQNQKYTNGFGDQTPTVFFHKSETGFVFRYPIIVISAHTNPVSYNTQNKKICY